MDKDKTKSQSSFSGPPSRKLTLTIPQAQHQLSSSNHSALPVYSYCDLLTNDLIRNNAKEWQTKRFNSTQLLVQNFRKAPFFKDILYQCTTNKSKSMFHIHWYFRYYATPFESLFIHHIHDRCLLLFVTFFKSPQASCSLAWSSKVVSTISLFGTGLQFEQDPGQHPDLILAAYWTAALAALREWEFYYCKVIYSFLLRWSLM